MILSETLTMLLTLMVYMTCWCRRLHDATNEFIITKAKIFRPVPGWNDFIKDKYKAAREAFLVWLNHGKIRSGALYDTMRYTRKVFVNALKYCRYHEYDIRNKSWQSQCVQKMCFNFGKQLGVKRTICKVLPMSQMVKMVMLK